MPFFQEESLSYCDPLKVVNVIFVQVENELATMITHCEDDLNANKTKLTLYLYERSFFYLRETSDPIAVTI